MDMSTSPNIEIRKDLFFDAMGINSSVLVVISFGSCAYPY